MKIFKESESNFLLCRRCPQTKSRITWPDLVVRAVIFLNLTNSVLCNESEKESNSEEIHLKHANESSAVNEARELLENASGSIWSQFLEDYVLSQSSSVRSAKDLQFLNAVTPNEVTMAGGHQMNSNSFGPNQNSQVNPLNYHSSDYKRYIPTNNAAVVVKRVGEEELDPHMRPPVQVVNPQFRPMTNHMMQQQSGAAGGLLQSLFGFAGGQQQQRPLPPQQQHHPLAGSQSFRAVTENDLYLLGAIEKLVYRVDYLESRVRRSEQLIYYLMAGNHQKEVRDPCPHNFSRISDNCYHINSQSQVNWKTANSACKAMNAHLAEFEKTSENEEIMAYLLNQPHHRGRDFWLGGLNPGLLWIWSNSAKPVNPNMNLTSIAIAQKGEAGAINDTSVDSDDKKNDTSSVEPESKETILNNTFEIKGQGRCLRLSFNPSKHSYMYYGQECTSRHNYICEYEDKTLDNKIKKIARKLKL